ncbi:GTP cyclohydrolase [Paraphotobacterium marinum]|uniref:GTP cyclohydrolase-2 n=1 Tax=Paraphotobacterium marinum TaxID=1755811 RepID=A0A220VEN0_9GAMM|nr:GTP cyclohydrolase II [Paraphotobacterium marinum]ASK78868.1 GTP cyclohydrolase [Paraphotobacterium marinum]
MSPKLTIRARVPFKVGYQSNIPAEIVTFHGLDSKKEHIAIIFGNADLNRAQTPLVRLHSECLTGDVFHSSRCDCGEQLNETIEKMGKEGGVLLYLRQEGRGIGLYNKIDAYTLQISGLNTYEANKHLGFGADLRDFKEAVQMLEALNIKKIKLITNNPKKIKQVRDYGLDVEQVVHTKVHLKSENEAYLKTKAEKGNHQINIKKINWIRFTNLKY